MGTLRGWTEKKNLRGYTASSQPSSPWGNVRVYEGVCWGWGLVHGMTEKSHCVLHTSKLFEWVETNMPHVYMLEIKKRLENKNSNKTKGAHERNSQSFACISSFAQNGRRSARGWLDSKVSCGVE